MKKFNQSLLALSVAVTASSFAAVGHADDFLTELLEGGKVSADFNLRYEMVDEDNSLDDANAVTLRSRLGFTTGTIGNFSAMAEFEDSRPVLGLDDYSVPQTGFHIGEYSVIADPQTTELDQAFVQYTTDEVTAKIGRQVIALDGQRFVGHVGWRQDRQTFDAATVTYTPTKELSLFAGFISQRNRIFAEDGDIDSDDLLLNGSYETPFGKVTGYYYMLEDDDTGTDLDTLGVSFAGKMAIDDSLEAVYAVEFATQEFDTGSADADADYMLLEGGVVYSGITAKLGYELLGSDNGNYGFQTPLATLHKFNGWADKFLSTPESGIADTYISVSAVVGPGTLTGVYHMFDTDESTDTLDELGSEIDVEYTGKFGKGYDAGVKLALYDADDFSVDTTKFWLWIGKKF